MELLLKIPKQVTTENNNNREAAIDRVREEAQFKREEKTRRKKLGMTLSTPQFATPTPTNRAPFPSYLVLLRLRSL